MGEIFGDGRLVMPDGGRRVLSSDDLNGTFDGAAPEDISFFVGQPDGVSVQFPDGTETEFFTLADVVAGRVHVRHEAGREGVGFEVEMRRTEPGRPNRILEIEEQSIVVELVRTADADAQVLLSQPDAPRTLMLLGWRGDEGAGLAVAGGGDFNGDGLTDVVVGAPQTFRNVDAPETFRPGTAYVVFGTDEGLPETLDLGALTPDQGFALSGARDDGAFGDALAFAGDVDGDGYDDLLIGAPGGGQSGGTNGGAFLVYGQAAPVAGAPALSFDGQTPGEALRWRALEHPRKIGEGGDLAAAGDVNGDGFADVTIGRGGGDFAVLIGNDVFENFAVPVMLGGAAVPSETLNLDQIDAPDGFAIELNLAPREDDFGFAVAGVGDMNGDGLDDVAVGAPSNFSFDDLPARRDLNDDGLYDRAGAVYVSFSQPGPTSAVELNDPATPGFVVTGLSDGDQAGYRVAAAGDMNGDGFADLAFSAPSADAEEEGVFARRSVGEVYVVFGGPDLAGVIDPLDFDGTDGFRIAGEYEGGRLGWDLASAGDVNGDGLDDLLIGSRFGEQAHVVYGRRDPFPAAFTTRDLEPATGLVLVGGLPGPVRNGALPGTLDGAAFEPKTGWSVAGAGDFDGDGADDVILGEPQAYRGEPGAEGALTRAGAAVIVFGGAVLTPEAPAPAGPRATGDLRVDGAPRSVAAVRIEDIDLDLSEAGAGLSLAAGRFENGFLARASDLETPVAAPTLDELRNGELVFVLPSGRDGSFFLSAADETGAATSATVRIAANARGRFDEEATLGDDQLIGTDEADEIFGYAGNDLLLGEGGADSLVGGDGDDELNGGGGKDDARGGRGEDVLLLGGGSDEGWGGLGRDFVYGGGGRDLLWGGGGSDSVYGGTGRDDLTAGNGRDALFGGGGADSMEGGRGADLLYGDAANDRLFGGGGGDSLFGGGGRDALFGGAGRDRLDGGTGRDVLNGGAGADILLGGGGPDVYEFAEGDGVDLVQFDAAGRDKIRFLSGAERFEDLEISVGRNFVTVRYGDGGDALRLFDVGEERIGASDFLFQAGS